MISAMKEIAGTLNNTHVQDWKKNGGHVIGYPCTYVPEEIMHAAKILPFRLRGIGTKNLSIGDTYFGPVICSFPKCVLQLAGESGYSFLDGAIMVNGCDSMRRLDECWRKAGEDYPGTLPGFFHYFGVPHKVTDYSLAWFIDEIKGLIIHIEDHFQIEITKESLHKSIRLFNESRKLLQRLDEIRIRETVPITGEDALCLVIAGFAMPREAYNKALKEIIDEIDKSQDIMDGKKRLMLAGSVNDDPDFVRLIEESGAVVVTDALCYGSKSYVDLTDEDEEPIASLARRYLSHSFCPRMFGCYKQRLGYIRQRIEKARVDGVILQNIRFCDLHGSENGIFERDLEAQGIPCMRMEREYGPLVETGRIRMRIDAFMERIG